MKKISAQFTFNSLICICNTYDNKMACYVVLSKTFQILNRNIPTKDAFNRYYDSIHSTYLNDVKSCKIYNQLLFVRFKYAKMLWKKFGELISVASEYESLLNKIKEDGFASWPVTDAVYIWPWLHIIAIDMDVNCGYTEKISFLNFIKALIGCSECKRHYKEHLNALVSGLNVSTCSRVLLAVHTFINTDNNRINSSLKFEYKDSLVDKFYLAKYMSQYIFLHSTFNS